MQNRRGAAPDAGFGSAQVQLQEPSAALYRGGNPMNDPRVAKGNTWARDSAALDTQSMSARMTARNRMKLLQANSRMGVGELMSTIPEKPSLPSIPIQTAPYLEAYPDKIEEVGAFTQTDPMLEVREPAPYVPPPEGTDVATQIEEGDLFDFDREVQPILDVLIGSVLQQAMREYADEEELRLIRIARDKARQRRAAELQEVRRLEEAERRRRAEVVKRQMEDLRRKEMEESIARKMAAQTFAAAYAAELEQDAIDAIETRGGFISPLEAAVTGSFVPTIITTSIAKAKARNRIHRILRSIIEEAVKVGLELEK